MAPAVDSYLSRVLPGMGSRRHRFLRSLLATSGRLGSELFIQSIERADRYHIQEIPTIENIAVLIMQQTTSSRTTLSPTVSVDPEDLIRREAYWEGSLTETPDLSIYRLTEDAQERGQEAAGEDQPIPPPSE